MTAHDPRLLLHAQFEEQARRTPDRVALYHGDRSITFADLKARSDRIAASLRSRGIRDGCFVGLHMERSIEYVVALLGVLKSNNAVVPLPPSYPEGRLRDILSFAALDAVCDADETPLRPPLGAGVIHFSDLSGDAGEAESAPPGSGDQPAFVLCSSGSTGTPKMIVRSHRSFFHRLDWTWDNHPYASGEVCCQKAYMTTTHAIYELFEPMLRGTPVVIIPDQEVRNLELFWETITRGGISRLLIVPSALQASLDMPGFVAPPIKVLVLMGEYVHPGLAERAVRAFPEPKQLFSIYGSTEASSTLVCDLKASLRPGEELPLGTPISSDVRTYVLGTDLARVAPGDAGMLYVGGPPLFKEYLKNPALTASVLVDAPDGAGKLYDTRDRVRLAADGSLQFVGRVDDTVKIRGFRVELQEVERALLLHPGIGHAAVLASESAAGSAVLLGFFAPATVDHASVYQALKNRLPAYMVPSVLVGLSVLPFTPSGKIDRRRLLEDYESRTGAAQSRDLSETEARIAQVWKDVLKHGDVRLDSSFFEVGGTSLTVFAALHRLRAAFSLDRTRLSDQSLYQFPTVADLASYIDSVKRGGAPLPTPRNAVLVTLKTGADKSLPPFFVIAPSGGTLGAYERLAKALETGRDVVGVRDPFIWGGRDPTMGFQSWVTLYVDAIRERQPRGPYYVGAYSSGGPFGYEIARRLRREGQEVALLVLIDPLGIDQNSRRRFGYWAFRARSMRPLFRRLVALAGWLRLAVPGAIRDRGASEEERDHAMTREQFLRCAAQARRNRWHIVALSGLLELNTGLPVGLADADLSHVEPEQYLGVLLDRVKTAAPDVDPETIENIAVQYYCLQTRAMQAYRLQRYDGNVVMFEPEGPHKGLVSVQFRPHLRRLRVRYLAVGTQSDRTRAISERFGEGLRLHYLSMRDDAFVRGLAQELELLLR